MSDKQPINWLYVILVVIFSLSWWIFWIQPRDEFLYSVMDCMNDAGLIHEDSYKACAEEIRNETR